MRTIIYEITIEVEDDTPKETLDNLLEVFDNEVYRYNFELFNSEYEES
jgi:hypothetical protein